MDVLVMTALAETAVFNNNTTFNNTNNSSSGASSSSGSSTGGNSGRDIPANLLPGVYRYGMNVLYLYDNGRFEWPSFFSSDTTGSYSLQGDTLYFNYDGGKRSVHRVMAFDGQILYLENGYNFEKVGNSNR
jgi:hypothetical protein